MFPTKGLMQFIPAPDLVHIPEVDHEQEMIDAYRVLCDAAFNVLTLPHKHRIKEREEYNERIRNVEAQVLPPIDYASQIEDLERQRDELLNHISQLDGLEEPVRTVAKASMSHLLDGQMKSIEQQLDWTIKQMGKEKP